MAEETVAERMAKARAQLALVPKEVTAGLESTPAPALFLDEPPSASIDLTKVPGVVGELVEWITRSARRPNRMLALAAAVAIVGTLIGRRIAGPTKSGTHLYIVALAGTAAGKQHAIDCIKVALASAGAAQLIGPGNFTSSQAVVKFVKRCNLSLCPMDEFGAFLRRINNKNAGNYEAEITGEFRKLWGICWSRYDSAESAKADSQAVECPALTIFGLATPEDFYSSLKSEDVGNGFLNRFLIIETGLRSPENDPPPGSEKLPPALESTLRKIFQPTPFGIPILHGGSNGKLEPGLRLCWGAGAKEAYSDLSLIVDNESDPQKQQLKSRVAEMAVRLATIRAAGRFSEIVSLDDMIWAREVAVLSSNMLCDGVTKHMVVPYDFAEICPKIISRVRVRGGNMTQRDIQRSFEKHVKRGGDIHGALKHLVESGQLTRQVVSRPQGGRESVIYALPEDGIDD